MYIRAYIYNLYIYLYKLIYIQNYIPNSNNNNIDDNTTIQQITNDYEEKTIRRRRVDFLLYAYIYKFTLLKAL